MTRCHLPPIVTVMTPLPQVTDLDQDRIVQIIPAAPGWFAHYVGVSRCADPEPGLPQAWYPIAAWALLEDAAGRRRIVGVDMTGTGPAWCPPVNPTDNLAEYTYGFGTAPAA